MVFDYVTFLAFVGALFPAVCVCVCVCVCVWMHEYLQPPRAVQWLCEVQNWSGGSGGLLHGTMLLERRHRQPKRASIRCYTDGVGSSVVSAARIC